MIYPRLHPMLQTIKSPHMTPNFSITHAGFSKVQEYLVHKSKVVKVSQGGSLSAIARAGARAMSVLAIQLPFIERQSTISRSPPHPKSLGQKAKSNN